jgi:ornithine carbamoyltransferase
MISFQESLDTLETTGPKHVLSSMDLDRDEIRLILDIAGELKAWRKAQSAIWPQDGLLLAMLFEKQSLRTRVSFEAAFRELGGHAIYLTQSDIDMGAREPVSDVAQVLSGWATIIVARVKKHSSLQELARYATVPVINALSDLEHPCQALADLMTIEEHFGKAETLKLVYVGDGNNVANSFAETASMLGHEVVVCGPRGYEPSEAALKCTSVSVCREPFDAVKDAHAVYTDVWVSMGQEEETEVRSRQFATYQVNEKLMAQAHPDAIFLHCLPAHRGLEVTADVIDGPKSVVFQQSENRLHAQKALMKLLMQGILKN